MKTTIKYKIIILFTLLDIILIFLFLLNQYNSVKREKFTEIESQMGKIALEQSSSFYNTQSEILKNGYIDDIQDYVGAIRELSKIVNSLNITSIKTIQEINNVLYITARSVTNKEFKSESYPLVIEPYLGDSRNYIKDILMSSNMKITYKDDNLIIPLKIKKDKYIILATITNQDIWRNLYMIFDSISWIIVILLISFVIMASIFLHVVIEKQVLAIYYSLKKFFKYLKSDTKKSEELEYIKRISTDEFGQISKMINENIKEIDLNTQINNKKFIKDKELIEELIKILTLAKNGDFKGRVESSGDTSKLNQLKDIVNDMLYDMNMVINELNSVLNQYVNNNFTSFIRKDEFEAQTEELISNVNSIGQNISHSLVVRAENIIKLYENSKEIDDFIKDSSSSLDKNIDILNQISINLENNLKFGLEFNHSVEVLKKENKYINNQLDKFNIKYNHIDKENIKITDDTLKDIRYSLYLFDKNIDKISSYSSIKVPSPNSTQELLELLKEELNRVSLETKNIKEVIKDFIHLINDIKFEIIENNDFIGKNRIKTYILYKWEVRDV